MAIGDVLSEPGDFRKHPEDLEHMGKWGKEYLCQGKIQNMCGKMSIERGYEAGHAYVDQLESLPRAVIMANDMTAIGFIDACRERGVRIPQDLSIVSFDGIELSGL